MKKSQKHKDPHAAREAEKYENPIPSREFILKFIENLGRPISHRRLAVALDLAGDQIEALRRRLKAMLRDGQLMRSRKAQFGLMQNMGLVKGHFIANKEGFGFVTTDDGDEDIYLSHREARSLFHGDEVTVRVVSERPGGKREGRLEKVVKRNTERVVGRFFNEEGVGIVEPANRKMVQNILIPPQDQLAAQSGQFVLAEIVNFPSRHNQAIGKIVEIIGEHMAPGMEIDVAIRSHELPHDFPEEVLAECEEIPNEVQESDLDGRKDLRHLSFVTIDGEDAKDFDDAVYCEKKQDKFRLYVAIADVSHYVKPGTALDSEAYRRGNSVYFPDRVIPMLPEKLSNGLCSLNPNVDRLCMVCDMTINADGKVARSQFYPAVMHSKERLTYTKVAAYLEEKQETFSKDLQPHINNLHDLYNVLRKKRDQRGAIELDTTETRIIFGENQKIAQIVPVRRNVAHRLIEEMMLCANVSAARYIERSKTVGLFRIHEPPSAERVDKFAAYLSQLGIGFVKSGVIPEPKTYANLLEHISGRPDEHIINILLLRSLSQAIYSPENKGHFGLAYDAYAHFTSPIRRYPDLFIHRAIKAILMKKPVPAKNVNDIAEHCSYTERRADDATRDAIEWLKCEYMLDKVGQTYEGVISSVTSFGLFVELKETYVEGLVHITRLNDYFYYDPVQHTLHAETSGQKYHMGDTVTVRVDRVDLDDRHIDFSLV
ncbi:MAG: ribonuclease R [Gammaproteobacteria bacterium]